VEIHHLPYFVSLAEVGRFTRTDRSHKIVYRTLAATKISRTLAMVHNKDLLPGSTRDSPDRYDPRRMVLQNPSFMRSFLRHSLDT